MTIKDRINHYEPQMKEYLSQLIQINSVEGTPTADAPFGEGPKKALLKALEQCQSLGFETKNIDNYAGYGQIGEGDKIIGLVGHLDVVPVGEGWDTPPFEMVEKEGVLYGRGVSDDKGAVVASMFALKIVKDLNVPLTKRVRLIMGTNEESGSACLHYYVEKEGHIDYGFTPDGEFPGVHGEKGMLAGQYHSKKTNIKDIQGGSATNIVCDNCRVVVEKNSFSSKLLEDYFNNENIAYTLETVGDESIITVRGVAAHASMPHLGKNAILMLMQGLKQAGYQDDFVDFYIEKFGSGYDGAGLDLNVSDEYGALTLNTGVISMKDGKITGSIDVRFPVTYTVKKIKELVEKHLDGEKGEIVVDKLMEPLFFPIDSPLVKTLYEAYTTVTGDTENKPLTMGGGTYAKGIHNCIAFGCAFPHKNYKIHDANEFLPIEDFKKQVEIYVQAILKLLEV